MKSQIIDSLTSSIVPGFNIEPDSISGLIVWLDASDSTTITPTRGVISSWRSKVSGYNFNTSTAFPSTGIATLNGKNVLTFNNQGVSTAGAVVIPSPRTIFTVARRTASFGVNHRIFWTNGNQGELTFGTGAATCRSANNATFISAAQTDNVYHTIHTVQNGASSIIGVDGVETTGAIGANAINNPLWIGHNATNRLRGNIAEILIYNRALNSTERPQVIQYLRNKWMI